MDLNDPMEGAFCYSAEIPRYYINSLRSEKMNTLICSLSKNMNNGLMWSFYADEHKGCCIELEVTTTKWTELYVEYGKDIVALNNDGSSSLEDILSRKSVQWRHEQEVRYIRTFEAGQRVHPYISVKIHKVILGMKVNRNDENFIKKLVSSVDPNIKVYKIKKEEIDFGYTL